MQHGRSPNCLFSEYVFQRRKDFRSIGSKHGLQFLSCARHQRAGGAHRYAESFGYLAVAQTVEVKQRQRQPVARRQVRNCVPNTLPQLNTSSRSNADSVWDDCWESSNSVLTSVNR